VPGDPLNPTNRRITIIVLRHAGVATATADKPARPAGTTVGATTVGATL